MKVEVAMFEGCINSSKTYVLVSRMHNALRGWHQQVADNTNCE